MRITIQSVDPETRVVHFSTAAGTGVATWAGFMPDVGTATDVEIDLDIDISHDNTTVVSSDTDTSIAVSPRGISFVAIVEQIDDDGMLFLRINANSTVMVEPAPDFVASLGTRLQIETTVAAFRLRSFSL